MGHEQRIMTKPNFHKLIATVFGIGYCPIAPGTAGSLAGLGLCLVLHQNLIVYLTAFALLFAAGVRSAGKAEEESGTRDPSFIVIDEFAGIFIVFILVPVNMATIITGFGLYRLFDIVKIPPLKLLEKPRKGWGIMLDDAGAAVYANLILQILLYFKII